MKITFVLPVFDLSGGVRVVAQYAERLHRKGHDVLVVGCPPAPPSWRARARGWARGRVVPHPRRGASHLEGLTVPHRLLERRRPVRASDLPDADVVVATWWETAEGVAALPPRKGVKAHFVQNDEAHPLWLPAPQRARAAAAQQLPLAKITISRSLVRLLRETYGERDVELVPNAVELELWSAPPRGQQRRPTVGFLYSNNPLKGVDVTLRALEIVRQQVPDLEVLTFGAQPLDRALPLPRGARFEERPPQEVIREIYASCDAWVCGSRCEGYHLPPLEAMACRTPVVSTRVGGPDDYLIDGENGFVVDVDDVDALADRVVRVLRAPEARWRAMSDAARRTAHGWTYDDATSAFESALHRVIARAQPIDLATSRAEQVATLGLRLAQRALAAVGS